MDSEHDEGTALERAFGARSDEPVAAAEDSISITVTTFGSVVKLDHVPLTATVAELVDSVRREPVTDWNEVALLLHRPGREEPQTLSPRQSLREADVQSGDTLIHAYAVRWASGWQEVAFFLATSSSAGVVGGAAYDLLKSTVRRATGRWWRRQGSASPSLSRDEALRIAQACLSLDSGIELRDLRSVEIGLDRTSSGGPETWIVSFLLAHSQIEVKVSVPPDGPEHALIFIDHQTSRPLPETHP